MKRRDSLKTLFAALATAGLPLTLHAVASGKRDRFGGWTGRKFKATGFFRVEKDERWWLVTPEGHAFLSFGINHLYPDLFRQKYNRESWQKRLGVEKLENWSQFAPALRTCVHDRCGDAEDATAFETCKATRCMPRTERWSIAPTSVRYDAEAGTVQIQARTRHVTAVADGEEMVRAREAFVGVTVVTTEGEEIDLAVQTLFPGRLSEDLMFLAEVGPGVQDILFGVWDRKIEPCDSTRSGCQVGEVAGA